MHKTATIMAFDKDKDLIKELSPERFDGPLPSGDVNAWSVYEEVAALSSGTERVRKHIERLNLDKSVLGESIVMRDAEIERLRQSLSEYGDHSLRCEWVEEASSGRLLNDKEDDLCSCGWAELRLQLQT